MEERVAGLRKQLKELGQEHVLAGAGFQDSSQQEALVEQLLRIDLSVFQRAVTDVVQSLGNQGRLASEPIPPRPFPRANWEEFQHWLSDSEDRLTRSGDTGEWWSKGLRLVAEGEVAVMVLAGGQGTRLGPGSPAVKGMLELDIPQPKSLFQLQAERLILIQELAALATGTQLKNPVPWVVMTSDATDSATRIYFEEQDYFGLKTSQVWFLKQSSLPCVDVGEGHAILMETPSKIAMAPAGNGSLFSDLRAAGVVEKLSVRGIKYVQVYAVDNALARVADPVFFGFVHEHQADIGIKVVSKKFAKESVGVVCLHTEGVENGNKRYGVIEYSEMPESLRTAEDNSGQLLFRAAHICINMFSVEYLKKLTAPKYQLEFHPAVKRISHVREQSGNWEHVVPDKPNGIKLERFIFDSFRYCPPEKVALLEVNREEEFAPIKNASGPGVADTAATACELILALHRRVRSLQQVPKMSKGLLLLRAYAGGQS